ncbi:hypothetical protein CLPU_6c00430 [Gottschalkia purinilytica]|uniref:Uncharacterized protein n=1 Tax=Gottschalkia purinilytica TaxID=1503 RepID=A0A0L0WAT3_GOTPU|nr:tape measure protein [Gottschalkia purinilytica]KNF08557.1 hypothetical protein CLPU_6c00430 [Gottschalkia purinilytica]
MSREFKTNVIIGGKLSPSLKSAFDVSAKYANKTSSVISSANNRAALATQKLSERMSNISGVIKKVAVTGAALGGAIGAKTMLEQASSLEQYKNTLNVVMKDQKKAGEIFKWAVDFANKTPYETDEIVQATVKLQSYGLEAKKVMGITGDMAAAMGKDIDQAVEAIADAQTGELERLKEFGITKEMIVKQAGEKLKGIEVVNNKGQITNQRAFNLALFSLMKDRYEGSMEIQSKTFKGLTSTISGIMKNGLAQIAGISETGEIIDNSAFDIAKKKVEKLSETISKMQENGTFEKIQKKVAEFVSKGMDKLDEIIPKIIEFGKFVIDNGPQIVSAIKLIGGAFLAFKTVNTINKGVTGLIDFGKNAKDTYDTVKVLSMYGKDHILKFGQSIPKIMSPVGSGLTKVMSTAGTGVTKAVSFVGSGIGKIASLAGTGISKATSFVVTGAPKLMSAVGTGISSALSFVGTGIMSVVSTIGSGIASAITFLMSPMGLIIIAIVAIVAALYYLWTNWDAISKTLVSVWQNYVLPFFQGIGGFFTSIFNGVLGVFKGVINWIIGGINTVINAVNGINFTVPDWVPGVGGQKFGINIPNVPTFAKGGIANQASIFGEAGPEMAIPLKKNNPRSVALLEQTARILGVYPKETSQSITDSKLQKVPLLQQQAINGLDLKQEAPRLTAKQPRIISKQEIQQSREKDNSNQRYREININYNPQIPSGTTQEVKDYIKSNYEEFKDYFEKLINDKDRFSFGEG